jgi:hypothetical protein
MEITFWNGVVITAGVLAVLMGLAAIALTIAKPGRNAQAIRAVAVVAVFTFGFRVGLAAAAWAAADMLIPGWGIKITKKSTAKKNK